MFKINLLFFILELVGRNCTIKIKKKYMPYVKDMSLTFAFSL